MRVSLPQLENAPEKHCGECTACCDVTGVLELGKPYYARCRHLTHNCAIYDERPDSCRKYRCAWHLGLLGDRPDRRPDKLGALFEIYDREDEEGTVCIEVYETKPDGLRNGDMVFLARKIVNNKKLDGVNFTNPIICLFPYGAQIHVAYKVSSEYVWTAPDGEQVMMKVDNYNPSVGNFAGAVSELIMPH